MQLAESNEYLLKLGEKIKALRLSKKLTLEALCYANGLEPSTVMRIEKAQTVAKITTLFRLAKAFNIPLSELVEV